MQVNEVVGAVGFVGYLISINAEFLKSLWRAGIVPVGASLGLGTDGEIYSINADHMAAACADYAQADRLIFVTDVAGVLDRSKVLQVVSCAAVEELIRDQKVSGGMVLKLEACKRALAAGVKEVRIVDGTSDGALLSAANGQRGPGTQVTVGYTSPASVTSLSKRVGEVTDSYEAKLP